MAAVALQRLRVVYILVMIGAEGVKRLVQFLVRGELLARLVKRPATGNRRAEEQDGQDRRQHSAALPNAARGHALRWARKEDDTTPHPPGWLSVTLPGCVNKHNDDTTHESSCDANRCLPWRGSVAGCRVPCAINHSGAALSETLTWPIVCVHATGVG